METNPEPISPESNPSEIPSLELDAPEPVADELLPVTRKRRNDNNVLAALLPFLTFALGIGVGFLVWGKPVVDPAQVEAAVQATLSARPTTSAQDGNVAQEPPQDIKRYDVPVDDDYIYGPENAPITIIEF